MCYGGKDREKQSRTDAVADCCKAWGSAEGNRLATMDGNWNATKKAARIFGSLRPS